MAGKSLPIPAPKRSPGSFPAVYKTKSGTLLPVECRFFARKVRSAQPEAVESEPGSTSLAFLHFFDDFHKAGDHTVVIFPPVREQTAGAVLYPVLRIAEIAAAAASERVERTVAEQAVEILRVLCLMAWEILAVPVLKKCVVPLSIIPSPSAVHTAPRPA